MRVLVIGDIIGHSGRKAVANLLPAIISEYKIDFAVANAENAANGFGVTKSVALELFASGIHLLTSGNHIWDKSSIIPFIKQEPRILRPANFPAEVPGLGSAILENRAQGKLGVINLSGRVFMESLDCPFKAALREIAKLQGETKAIVVDFHAEATSEKIAMGWFLDGKVSAVIGTHTHVQTADEKILPGGTAYITDIGMTGAADSVIGMKKELALKRFLTQMPFKFSVAEQDVLLHGICVEIDARSGKSRRVERIQRSLS